MSTVGEIPSPRQKQIIWASVTALALAGLFAVIGFFAFLLMQVADLLYPVLLPLGVAAVIAYILDPLMTWLEGWKLSRQVTMLVLLGIVFAAGLIFLVLVVPPIVEQTTRLLAELPATIALIRENIVQYLDEHEEIRAWVNDFLTSIGADLPNTAGQLANVVWAPFKHVFGYVGLIIGFLFVPLYVYYFLIYKETIEENWREYVPLHKSWWRDEIVGVLAEINRYLVVFFRGQVVVGIIIGILIGVGLTIIGLPFAALIGLAAGVLSLVPYLGSSTSLIIAVLVGYFTSEPSVTNPYAVYLMPGLVIVVFSIVQTLEGFFITPKIIGDSTGLHPFTVIISILVWTLILPGLLGPILAVPLTATLRVLMYRYVWLRALPELVAAEEDAARAKALRIHHAAGVETIGDELEEPRSID